MTQIKIKRVYEPEEQSDGYRVLVDKLWPRGISKEELPYDDWAKGITPSTGLREWFHVDEEGRWEEFKKRYIDELNASPDMKDFIRRIKEKPVVTLLFASKNAVHNHALILQDYIEKALR